MIASSPVAVGFAGRSMLLCSCRKTVWLSRRTAAGVSKIASANRLEFAPMGTYSASQLDRPLLSRQSIARAIAGAALELGSPAACGWGASTMFSVPVHRG